MTPETLLALTLAIPFAAAVILPLAGRWPNVREGISLLAGVALFATVYALWQQGEVTAELVLVTVMPGITLALHIESVGLVFALTGAFLWPVTTLYAAGYMRGNREPHQTRFAVCFALSLGAAMGIALASNLFTLFTFYELMTLVTYPLVTHHGNAEARKAGRVYIGLLMFTSIAFQLTAIVWTWMLTGRQDFVAGGILADHATPAITGILLLLYMYGIGKAALMPVHRWLPAAMVAPTPVSALLHAVAVVKAGVFSVVKIIVYIFGVEHLSEVISLHWWSGGWLPYLAGATVILGSIIALRQDNLKKRLAYSTVSQLSYITMTAAVLTPLSVKGAILHIGAHAFGKITLFFAAGAIYTAAHKTHISQLAGIGKVMPWTMTAFTVGALSMVGVPPMVGFISKWYMLSGAAQAGHYFVIAVMILSTLFTAAYYLPIIQTAFFKPAAAPPEHGEAPWQCVVAIVITAAGTVLLFFVTGRFLQLADAVS